jgi:predicted RNase H-like HicB family nuclease
MTESISLEVHLQAFVRRDTSRRWIATCPMVGVVSQGRDADDAQKCLREAVELWFESCVERGVLDQALREANFRPSQSGAFPTSRNGSRRGRDKHNILGDRFEVHLKIPAYEGAALLGAIA